MYLLARLFTYLLAVSLVQLSPLSAIAQDAAEETALAKTYLQKQEYDKANSIFSKLISDSRQFNAVYPDYLKTLLALKNYKEAEKRGKKAIKTNPDAPAYVIDLGIMHLANGDKWSADKEFDKVISQAKGNSKLLIAQSY